MTDIAKYRFYGADDALLPRIVPEYKGIDDPYKLYDALEKIWCADTCAPRMRDEWSPANKTLGQCSITAFLVQDIFGGKVSSPRRERSFQSSLTQ